MWSSRPRSSAKWACRPLCIGHSVKDMNDMKHWFSTYWLHCRILDYFPPGGVASRCNEGWSHGGRQTRQFASRPSTVCSRVVGILSFPSRSNQKKLARMERGFVCRGSIRLTLSKNGMMYGSSSNQVSKSCGFLHHAHRTFPSFGARSPHGHQNCENWHVAYLYLEVTLPALTAIRSTFEFKHIPSSISWSHWWSHFVRVL